MSKKLLSSDGSRSEAGVKEDIKQWLIAHRIYDTKTIKTGANPRGFFWMPVPSGMGISGVSDFLICFGGRLVAPEVKAENRPAKPSPDQKIFIGNVIVVGGLGFTVNSLKMFVDIWVKEVDYQHFLYFPEEKNEQ
jgi:hypothetical protein